MKAYGYEVKGNEKVLNDIKEAKRRGAVINWNLFEFGDIYYTGNGEEFEVVTDDHANKIIVLEEV